MSICRKGCIDKDPNCTCFKRKKNKIAYLLKMKGCCHSCPFSFFSLFLTPRNGCSLWTRGEFGGFVKRNIFAKKFIILHEISTKSDWWRDRALKSPQPPRMEISICPFSLVRLYVHVCIYVLNHMNVNFKYVNYKGKEESQFLIYKSNVKKYHINKMTVLSQRCALIIK